MDGEQFSIQRANRIHLDASSPDLQAVIRCSSETSHCLSLRVSQTQPCALQGLFAFVRRPL